MADEDENGMDDEGMDGASQSSGKKKGLLIPGFLKWIAIGIGAIILIVTVVVITMKIIGTNSANVPVVPQGEEFVQNREILDWYTSLGQINTKTSGNEPASVMVDVVLGYKKEDKATSTEITQRTVELKDFLRRYFTQKTPDELRPQNEENLKIEIRNAINDSILTNTKIKDVRFMRLDVIQQ
ncbi:MAG: flagellar basal body-associated FliL family protein [Treponema sp.]|nr:flagellar basal body-associated FliL family protein [Treponema sp.]